ADERAVFNPFDACLHQTTHNHQSPIANHNASKLRGFKMGANGGGGAWVLCAYSSLQGAAWPKRPPSMLRPDNTVLNRVKIGEGSGRPEPGIGARPWGVGRAPS